LFLKLVLTKTMQKILRMLAIAAMALTIASPFLAAPAPASAGLSMNDFTGGHDASAGLGASDPRDIATAIIRIILGFLGILAVVIILIGGFKWMTAAGNEEGVEEAKKILIAGVIGLAIVLAAWGIASFVLSSLITATNA
jgi:hypothetical protein